MAILPSLSETSYVIVYVPGIEVSTPSTPDVTIDAVIIPSSLSVAVAPGSV